MSLEETETKLKRSAKVTFIIQNGEAILKEGQETARHLWNFTRWCVIGFNRKLQSARVGKIWDNTWEGYKLPDGTISRYVGQSVKGQLPKYPGKFTMQKELKDYWAAQNLSDRCFSYTIKDFDIAMRSWFSNLRNNPQARPPRYAEDPRQLTFEVDRNAKPVGDWTYRLTVLGGHIPERHTTVKIHHIQPGIKMKDIKLIRIQPDQTGSIVYCQEQKGKPGEAIAAVDLGIINIATIAFDNGESIMVSGKGILASDQYYQKRAARCKPSGWMPGQPTVKQSSRNKSYRLKAGNIRRLAVHNLTRFIIQQCTDRQVGTIIIGDLTGIRKDRDHGKAGNQKLHAWPFAEIGRQIIYKAEEAGIEVIKRSERNTSKYHCLTGEQGVRNPRGLITFKESEQIIHSDVNGAFGILNNYLVEIGKTKVSPVPKGIGVEGVLSALPSLGITAVNEQDQGIGKAQFSQIHPTFAAKFDLRDWSIVQDR